MSKMFDALRRAEEQRRKRAVERKEKYEAGAEPPGMPLDVPLDSLPDNFLREIGMLRNSIESALKGKEKESLLFTSSTRREGSTTISINYAKLLAMQKREKVLLCEMNARNPAFAEKLSLSDGAGISDVFTGRKTISSVIQYLENFNLYVAHIGKPEPATIQLHLATVFPKLIEDAFKEYDMVVFDAPPITISPESPPMSTFVDGVVLVVQAGKTKREVVQRSMNAISQLNGNILGVILNRKKYYIPEFLYKRV
jgi:capsular exopolysaccharide synthesis family protein